MAGGYSQKFTLTDIFNNKKLAGKLPLINYRERVGADGREHRTTNIVSVPALVFNTAKSSAKPYYKPLIAVKAGNDIDISGTLIGNYYEAYEAVYQGLVAQKAMLSFTANNADIIRTALKEGQAMKRNNGQEPKLWLRAGSMLEIENMTKPQLQALMTNIMENLFFGSDFAKTQQKYRVDEIPVKSPYSFEQRQAQWQRRTGAQ